MLQRRLTKGIDNPKKGHHQVVVEVFLATPLFLLLLVRSTLLIDFFTFLIMSFKSFTAKA
jgi:hypothetical protein